MQHVNEAFWCSHSAVCPTCTLKHTFHLAGERCWLIQALEINAETENISFAELKSSVTYTASICVLHLVLIWLLRPHSKMAQAPSCMVTFFQHCERHCVLSHWKNNYSVDVLCQATRRRTDYMLWLTVTQTCVFRFCYIRQKRKCNWTFTMKTCRSSCIRF